MNTRVESPKISTNYFLFRSEFILFHFGKILQFHVAKLEMSGIDIKQFWAYITINNDVCPSQVKRKVQAQVHIF